MAILFENHYLFTQEDCEQFIRKTEQKKLRPAAWILGLLLLTEAVLLAALDLVYSVPFWLSLVLGIGWIWSFEFSFPRHRARARRRAAQKLTGTPAAESVVTVTEEGITLQEGQYSRCFSFAEIRAFLDCDSYLVLMTKTGPFGYTGIPLRRDGFTVGDLSSCYAFLSAKQPAVRWFS